MFQDIAKVAEALESITAELAKQEDLLLACVRAQECENAELIEKTLCQLTASFAVIKKEMQSLAASLIHEFSDDLFAAYTQFIIHEDKHPFVKKCKGAFQDAREFFQWARFTYGWLGGTITHVLPELIAALSPRQCLHLYINMGKRRAAELAKLKGSENKDVTLVGGEDAE